jgi:hypothetical protein
MWPSGSPWAFELSTGANPFRSSPRSLHVIILAPKLSKENYLIKRYTAALAGAALSVMCVAPVFAQTTMSSPMPMASGSSMSTPAPGGSMKGGSMMKGGSTSMGMAEHGMPAGGDGYTFNGKPDLAATISLVKAGGGPANFSLAKALTAMVGPALTTAEVNKLTKQYGASAVKRFVTVQNFAVQNAAATAIAAGVKFPNSNISGHTLAARLVMLGVPGNNGAYFTGTMLDHLVTNKIHESTMDAIDAKYGKGADANYHKISNQAFYDLAQALGAKTVKLASFH